MEKDKFCRCIKSVRKTLKARKGKGSLSRRTEQGAIAVCVKSVLQTRGRTMKKFRCGKKGYLKTQKLRRGGASVWAAISADTQKLVNAIHRTPAKEEELIHEFGKRYFGQDISPLTDEDSRYYDKARQLAEPYPALRDWFASLEQGSSAIRRMPMLQMRAALTKEKLEQYNGSSTV